MTDRVIGVDGCKGGWIAVIWGDTLEHRLCQTFAEVLELNGRIIAVDMPMGFQTLDCPGGRLAERELRRFLRRKSSSVFPSPARATVESLPPTFAEARSVNRRNSRPEKSLTIFTYNILGKMNEIDREMTAARQARVHETHPEASFAIMNDGQPVLDRKAAFKGHELRRSLLVRAGFPLRSLPPSSYRRKDVRPDDLLDACACAWSARRILEGRAVTFPAKPETDARGLRMQISA